MASMTFMPYVDKENAGSLGIHPGKGQQRASSGLGGGKVFGSSAQKKLVTPRRALGDVSNRGLSLNSNSQGLKQQKPAFKPPSSQQKKGLKLQGNKQSNVLQTKTVTKEKAVPIEPHYDEIEHMHIPKKIEDDDFEDIWPKSERISTYISQLISWRPPCPFSHLPESGDETDEEEERKKRMEDLYNVLDNMPKPLPSVCDLPDLDDDNIWVPEPVEAVSFPSSVDFCEISLPLDDSLDILPYVGELRLHETP
ncbi:uncharacterized protein LOC110451710 [Mizuhopecten yessoensis]|uniref:Securin n=1 Tax=Mizuhopecten yessoensis TaxID=6573 RepID=A0A210QL71_MIZYE|nr:uncharacterized protein LOC110451710 [Mizuhopecten yessoensis]OWF49493.1 hypothetical protein KP79_PYT17524 [Mizuhopecten yessoensis]